MTALSDILRNHVDYTTWATGRLLNAGTMLNPDDLKRDFGTADKSIQGSMTHLLRSERNWLRRLQGDTDGGPLMLPADEHWEGMTVEWRGLHEKWRQWAAGLNDEDVLRVHEYKDLKGTIWNQPIWQIVLHVVNHSTHHRGQVSGFLRALGQQPPPLDFILFMRGQF